MHQCEIRDEQCQWPSDDLSVISTFKKWRFLGKSAFVGFLNALFKDEKYIIQFYQKNIKKCQFMLAA